MGESDSRFWPMDDAQVRELRGCIADVFPVASPSSNFSPVSYGIGDDWGSKRTAEVLSGPWTAISSQWLDKAGSDLIFHLSAEGLLYYLPAILTSLLETRSFGWFEEALLPGEEGYEDVVGYFSGGVLSGERGKTAKRYFERVTFVKSRLSSAQCECVAKHIEIAETSGRSSLDADFLRYVKKYTDYWRARTPS